MNKLVAGTLAAGLLFAASAQAAFYNKTEPFSVNLPVFKGSFEFALTGEYLRSTTGHLGYVLIDNSGLDDVEHAKGCVQEVEPGYAFGYELMAGWRFNCSSNDVRLIYTKHESCCSDDVRRRGETQVLFPTLGLVDLTFIKHADAASAKASFDSMTGHVEFGQHINIGCRMSLRLFTGLSYANLDREMSAHYVGDSRTNPPQLAVNNGKTESVNIDNCFRGIGPRFGVEGNYALWGCFGMVASFATDLYVGCADSKSSVVVDAPDVQIPQGAAGVTTCSKIENSSHTMIVPAVTARLGVNYSYCFSNCSSLTAELGYKIRHYFNVVHSIHWVDDIQDANHVNSYDGWSQDGVYLTLHYVM